MIDQRFSSLVSRTIITKKWVPLDAENTNNVQRLLFGLTCLQLIPQWYNALMSIPNSIIK